MTANHGTQVAHYQAPRMPLPPQIQNEYGVTSSQWKTLIDAVFPSAKTVDAVGMALNYCKVRGLDPFKRPVNIVPMWDSKTNSYRETVWPGINEVRTTAHRTNSYAGREKTLFGPDITRLFEGNVKTGQKWEKMSVEVTFPEYAEVTVYRMINGHRCPFTATVYWLEIYGRRGGSSVPNEMWCKRARGQLDKCAEAAALRMAFPEEAELTAEEMEGQIIAHDPRSDQIKPTPAPAVAAEPEPEPIKLEAAPAEQAPREREPGEDEDELPDENGELPPKQDATPETPTKIAFRLITELEEVRKQIRGVADAEGIEVAMARAKSQEDAWKKRNEAAYQALPKIERNRVARVFREVFPAPANEAAE